MRLLMLTGLGDNYVSYRLTLPLWWWNGFRPHLYKFDWNRNDGRFEERFGRLLAFVDGLPVHGEIGAIGASAGGTVAANLLLARPERIERAAAIASPLGRVRSHHSVLNGSLERLRREWPEAPRALHDRLRSFVGVRDERVPCDESALEDVIPRVLSGRSHAGAIGRALTIHASEIARWVRFGHD